MTLIKFEGRWSEVYINPEHVTSVINNGEYTIIRFDGDNHEKVKETLEFVIAKLLG